jgi:hypothetical protein|tara:strand:+ start:826 stop:1122 length:297 start_codon:yes stop_codon:yes gene_type:complete
MIGLDNNGRPKHIEAYLVTVRSGQWFGWSDSKNKVYENLIVHDGGSKPSESDCTNGLVALQTSFDDAKIKLASDKTSGNNKLKALGLTDDEITAITKG